MKLTKRQREVLEQLNKPSPENPEDEVYPENEITVCGLDVYLGSKRTNHKMVKFLLLNVLISSAGDFCKGDYRIYNINEWGRRALAEPSFDPYAEMERDFRARQNDPTVVFPLAYLVGRSDN